MSAKKPLPGYMWLLAGLAIGLFVAFLVFLKKQPAEQVSFTQAVKQELEKARQNKDETPPAAAEKNAKPGNEDKPAKTPRFDFYTILPELEVFIPESEINRAEPRHRGNEPDNVAAAPEKKQYLLQAGSFRNREDADRLKANLALLGVQSSIQSVNINSESWHRVRIGPFGNPDRLRETLGILKQNNIHAMTMELKD